MPPARVVQVKPGERRAPVLENTDQTTFLEVWREFPFRQEGDAQAVEGRGHDVGRRVDDDLAFDTNFEFAAAALEFPRVEPT